jgi:hypothetical protein
MNSNLIALESPMQMYAMAVGTILCLSLIRETGNGALSMRIPLDNLNVINPSIWKLY